jgi:Protein of unknown function (DUF1194)
MNFVRSAASVVAAMAVLSLGSAAEAVPVDLELSLLVDVSGSVDDNEFSLQRGGYSSAFRNGAIQNAILDTSGGRTGAIAVNFIYWSSAGEQQQALGWTLIDSAAASNAFADAIDNAGRPFFGLTAPGSALTFATPLFANNGYEGSSLIIDVSGDGAENDGVDTATARDAALAAGIDRINGIAILGESGLEDFYMNEVIGGTDAFLLTAATFEDFEDAIAQKLKAEITGEPPAPVNPIPLPASVWLLMAGLGGFGLLRRSRSA